MTAYAYDHRVEPPAPVVPLRVGPPDGETAVLLPALIDSGADLTVIPAAVAGQLGLMTTDHVTVRAGGTTSSAGVCAAQIELEGVAEIVEVLAWQREALLGRNLLQQVVATLDGPAAEATIVRSE